MSLTIDLPKDLERELAAVAAREGLEPGDLALRLLRAAILSPAINTGADLVAYWEKERLIGSRPDIQDSQKHAREIRQAAEERRFHQS